MARQGKSRRRKPQLVASRHPSSRNYAGRAPALFAESYREAGVCPECGADAGLPCRVTDPGVFSRKATFAVFHGARG